MFRKHHMKKLSVFIFIFQSTLLFAQTKSYDKNEAYPSRHIRMIIPQPAGGSADTNARAMSETLGKFLGQNIVIDNRGSANGIIAGEIFMRAPPDGHTLLFASGSLITNQVINKNTPFDALQDFIPITQVAKTFGYIVLVNPRLGVTTMKDLVELSKKRQINYGSGGIGNALHLGSELINIRSGSKMVHVPYRGLAPVIPALISNEIQVALAPPLTVLQHIKNGRLHPLAYTGAKRWSGLPEVPTMEEFGVQNCIFEPGGHGIFSPAKTPTHIINKIHSSVVATIKTPTIVEHLSKGGYTPVGNTPEEFRRYLKDEIKKITEIVRITKIEIN